jgi:hypothetical protein
VSAKNAAYSASASACREPDCVTSLKKLPDVDVHAPVGESFANRAVDRLVTRRFDLIGVQETHHLLNQFAKLLVVLCCFRLTVHSEVEFQRPLQNPRCRSADHITEGGTADVSIDRLRTEELGMIEDIERFHSKEQRF